MLSATGGLLRAAGLAGSTAAPGASPSLQLPSQPAILATMSSVNNYWIQAHSSAGSITNNWDGAVYMIGDMDAYAATGNSAYLNYAKAWASAYSYGLSRGNSSRNADSQAAGEVYVRLYQLLGTSSDLTNITANVKAMVNSSTSTDWTWVDALNMAMPVFAELGQINADPAYAAKMYSEYSHTKSSLYDQSESLWWRDSTFVGTSFWSRGNAWAFVAHAKVLETLPTTDSHYLEYLGVFRAMAAKLLTLQQSDGFWYANLTNPSQYPTPETSGTAGFTYGLAWGINAGVLDSATYLPAVTKAWNGMVATAVHANGLLGYVQGVGSQPSSSQPVTSTSTADYGVGLFLEAGNQVLQLAAASVATPTFNPPAGTYASALSVTITSATSGASIAYTTDGTTPTESGGTVTHGLALANGGSVFIITTTTLKALAFKAGLTDSTVATGLYTFSTQVAAPTFNPLGGNFSSALSVTIASATSGASIAYTTDGTMPTESGGTITHGTALPNGAAVSISASTTLNAMAYITGMTDSPVTTGLYTISQQVAGPMFNPPAGTYTSAQAVTITSATSGASIAYTTDGTMPTESGGTVTHGTALPNGGSVAISGTTTLEAMAFESGMTDSTVTSGLYTISVATRFLTGSSSNGWHALALTTAQAGTFTATFDATPTASPENAVVGLSKGVATAYGNLSCIARFNPTGQIDAYNGTAFQAALSIPYAKNTAYHFRMVVNVPAHTYSVYVTPTGGTELTVGLNYVFRVAQASLDTWNLDVNASPSGCSLTANNLNP